MKSSDLTTIISGVLGVALIAMAAIILLYEPANIIFAGALVTGALGLNGYNAALLAPSPKQGEQIAQAVAAAAPQVPLVNIVHPASSAPDIQVSSAAMPPVQQQGPQPIMFPPQGQVVSFPQSRGQSGPWQAQPPLSEDSMPLAAISRTPPTQQQ